MTTKSPADLFNLKERVAIVTGGGGLLGAQFCQVLAQAGAKVVVADLNGAAAKEIAGKINQAHTAQKRALAALTDVTDPASVEEMVSSTLEAFGRLDILVNSAALDPKFDPQHVGQISDLPGPATSGAFESYPLEAWNQAINVNLTGAFLCCQAAARPMLEAGRGVIINISSIYGLSGPDQRIYQRNGVALFKPVYYSVTKAGIIGLTRYLATYYAGKHIRVNTLTPGGVDNNHAQDFKESYSARAVLGRMAQKDEMNGALLFLASDASAYMTGANLVVDGGWTAW